METELLQPSSSPPPPVEPATVPITGQKKSPLKLFALLIALLVCSGAAVYVFAYYQNSPAKILAKMHAELSKLAFGKFQARANVSFPPELFTPGLDTSSDQSSPTLPRLIKINLELNGIFDTQDKHMPKTDVRISGKISGVSQDPFDISGDFRTIGGEFYLKPDQLPPTTGFDLSPLLGVWLKFDSQTATQGLESSPTSTASNASPTNDLASVKQFYADINRLYYQSLTVAKNYGRETLAGRPVYHYQVALDRENFLKALDEYANASSDPQIKTYASIVKANPQSLQTLAAELWVGQKDYLPYQVKFDIPMGTTGGHTALTLNFSDYNQPVAVTPPEGAKSFQDTLQKVFDQAQVAP